MRPSNRVWSHEPGAAAHARLARPAICGEPFDEATALPLRVSIVAKARPPVRDRFGENGDDLVSQARRLIGLDASCRARRIDSRAPERLVRIDVSDACHNTLVHQHLFDRGPRTPKKYR
jgi:hypothetical protein